MQSEPCMNDMLSSRQHQPNQIAQPIFSRQPSPQHEYQQTAYQNLPAVIAPDNVTHTQEAVLHDLSNQ